MRTFSREIIPTSGQRTVDDTLFITALLLILLSCRREPRVPATPYTRAYHLQNNIVENAFRSLLCVCKKQKIQKPIPTRLTVIDSPDRTDLNGDKTILFNSDRPSQRSI